MGTSFYSNIWLISSLWMCSFFSTDPRHFIDPRPPNDWITNIFQPETQAKSQVLHKKKLNSRWSQPVTFHPLVSRRSCFQPLVCGSRTLQPILDLHLATMLWKSEPHIFSQIGGEHWRFTMVQSVKKSPKKHIAYIYKPQVILSFNFPLLLMATRNPARTSWGWQFCFPFTWGFSPRLVLLDVFQQYHPGPRYHHHHFYLPNDARFPPVTQSESCGLPSAALNLQDFQG